MGHGGVEIEEYFGGICDGKIIACDKLQKQAARIMEQLVCPHRYHFDIGIAAGHIEFIEQFCKTPTGKIGTPLKLTLYQIATLQAIFGFVDDNGIRQYNEVLDIMGRKNGKTTWCSGIELDMLCNDGEGAPQVYNVATQREQATLGFNACHKMVKQSPGLCKHIRKRSSDLYFDPNLGFIRALASNTNSLDGLDISCAIIDELAAIKNRDIYDLVKQAMSARRQPLLFCISTNGFVRNGIFDKQYQYAADVLDGKIDNDRFLPLIYELDSVDEMWDEANWVKANPGLGEIKSLDYLRECVQKAKDDDSFLPTVLVKDFNIPQTSESAWLKYEWLNSEEQWDIAFDYGIGGFDAADTIDLNAAKAVYMRPGDDNVYVESMYWIPQALLDEEDLKGDRRGRDSAPYRLWIEQGYMRVCPGHKCDKRIFLDWFKELNERKDVYFTYIGYDPWHIDDTLLREFKAEFGKDCMIPVRQGVYTLSQPMKTLASDFKAHKIIYNNNPIDKWCLINSQKKTDTNGEIQLVKSLDRTQRIDGTAALLCAYVVLQDKMDEYVNLNQPAED